jgi:hypothetical protein
MTSYNHMANCVRVAVDTAFTLRQGRAPLETL